MRQKRDMVKALRNCWTRKRKYLLGWQYFELTQASLSTAELPYVVHGIQIALTVVAHFRTNNLEEMETKTQCYFSAREQTTEPCGL
jgi:hypothetical protein